MIAILTLVAWAEPAPDSGVTVEESTSRWIGWSKKTKPRSRAHGGDFDHPPVLEWQARLPGPTLNSASHTERARPVFHGDEILIGGAAGGGLYRLDRGDGAVRGVFEAHASVESEALVVDDRVYFADTSGTTWCYGLDGELVWENRGNAPILTQPTLANGVVYITNVDDLVIALDSKSGEQIWRHKAKRDLTRVAELALYAAPGAVVDSGEVIVGFSSGALVALDALDGTLTWSLNVGEGRYPDLVAAPTVAGSDLFVSGYFKPLLAVDRESHSVRWRAEAGAAYPVLVDDGTVYHPGTDGVLRAFSVLTGAEKWAWSSGTTAALTEPQITTAGLVIAASGGSIYLIDPDTGKLKWMWNEPELLEGVTATPAIDGRQLVFLSNSGILYSLVVPHESGRDRPSNRTLFRGEP